MPAEKTSQEPLGDIGVDIAGLERSRHDRVDRLVRPDLVGVDPTENQQMVVVRQMVQGADHGLQSFVAPDKTEHANQPGVPRHGVENRKTTARRRAAESSASLPLKNDSGWSKTLRRPWTYFMCRGY